MDMGHLINQTVLMSGADYFDVVDLNPFSHLITEVDRAKAIGEHAEIRAALEQAGVKVVEVDAPENCQDGIFTANWGLCRGNKVILANLPGPRKAEEAYAEQVLRDLGKEIMTAPYHFSGQGDALPCGNYLLAGSGYRTDPQMHDFIAEQLGFEVITLQAVPELDASGQPMMNALTGWPDSFFYDIDLAISVLRDDLIAWCPEAFTPESQQKIHDLPLEKLEVSYAEATQGFACNLVSTGETVIMSAHAPELKANIEAKGLRTLTPEVSELGKGGGYIRCTTLTLD